ncbi:MAG TPA: MMPL family transporter [Burkholderiales bacterium]|nr:MMPL family transporter [Burkholderiales bacterium]
MTAAQRWALGAWLALLAASAVIVARTTISTDVSAFLPRSPTPEQQVLVEQLREGVVSRLALIALEGASPAALAQASKAMAAELRKDASFVSVENGDGSGDAADREFLWRHRYLLSSAVDAERFSAAGLRERLEETLRLLDSPAGALVRRIVANDPTGELLHILESLEAQSRPATREGVWFSRDGRRALLLAQTRAPGYDVGAQEGALARIVQAFSRAGTDEVKLLVSGPGVFAARTRVAVRNDALRLSLIATALVAGLLLAVYRSGRLLALGLVPIASGALAGIAAVSLGFGSVHGITLGFGVTLIGEGVDYAIYLFTQAAGGGARHAALERIWPTLRLGVLTSICGFSAMLFSGFTGLAQLGLFSIVGLLVAVAVTRWVLPGMLPSTLAAPIVGAAGPWASAAARRASSLRYPVLILVAAIAVLLAARGERLWNEDLASLSPVPRVDQALDEKMRADLGAPDVRFLVVIHAPDQEAALQASEAVGQGLRKASQAGMLEGYESPADFLPSRQTQEARRQALPEPAQLRANLEKAVAGLPFRGKVFEPFLADAAAARSAPPIGRSGMQGTRLALRVDSLLARRADGWAAMLPLRNVADAAGIARDLTAPPGAQAVLLDLKRESEQLYHSYRAQALAYSLLGAAAIGALLLASLRSLRSFFAVTAPLVAAVLVTTGALALAGESLSIFHLVGLLLVVAIGSNYSLLFDRQASSQSDRSRTLVSLLLANATTVIGFGLLALSRVPVLHDIGVTVGLGTVLALVFSAILGRRHDHA